MRAPLAGQSSGVDMVDGVYDAKKTEIMLHVAGHDGAEMTTDRNIFEWYREILPKSLAGCQVIDWGAGVGRFFVMLDERHVAFVTFVEPSSESCATLRLRYSSRRGIEIVPEAIGAKVVRSCEPEHTYHLCTFVVNCIPSVEMAFVELASSIRTNEKLFIVTNVFAPNSLVAQIATEHASAGLRLDLCAVDSVTLKKPIARTFTNEIIGTGQLLTDAVHLLDEYKRLLTEGSQSWEILESRLMLPDGFRHVIQQGEEFGDYTFAVLGLQLIRK